MSTVRVNASTQYDVIIAPELLDRSGSIIRELLGARKAALITDDSVWRLYGYKAVKSLSECGFEVYPYIIPHGEASKNMATLANALEFLAGNRLTRSDLVIALGGGVVGDLAGFCAAVYLRGIRFVQLPTTLLAAVDSSVGGKTAVDLGAGKNLAGAFKQPELVLCDTRCIRSLSDSDFASGAAEAIKYGVLSDPALFEHFERSSGRNGLDLERVITDCVKNKAHVVEQDEFDTGLRQTLNLGHTIGHGVEKCSGYTIPHGHAVAIGMAMISTAAERLGMALSPTAARIKSCLEGFGLPTATAYTPRELADAALGDKKRDGGSITLIVPQGIGRCTTEKIPVSKLEQIISLGV